MYAKLLDKKKKGNYIFVIVRDNGSYYFYRRRTTWGPMPFDRFDRGTNQFVHATGNQYFDYKLGCWRDEYEDDLEYELCQVI